MAQHSVRVTIKRNAHGTKPDNEVEDYMLYDYIHKCVEYVCVCTCVCMLKPRRLFLHISRGWLFVAEYSQTVVLIIQARDG